MADFLINLRATGQEQVGGSLRRTTDDLNRAGQSAERLGPVLNRALGRLAAIGGVAAILRGIANTLEQANRIRDLAEQYQLHDLDVLRIRQIGARIGVREGTALRGIASLQQARALAAQGDKDTIALFRQFGVTLEQINNLNVTALDIGRQIRRSLGAQGALPSDAANLRKLVGFRWQQQLALFAELDRFNTSIATEQDLAKLDAAQKKIEQFKASWEQFKIRFLAVAIDAAESFYRVAIRAGPATPDLSQLPRAGQARRFPRTALDRPPGGFSTWEEYQRLLQQDRERGRAGRTDPATSFPTADALTRIGGIRGGAQINATLAEYRQRLRSIHEELRRVNFNLIHHE